MIASKFDQPSGLKVPNSEAILVLNNSNYTFHFKTQNANATLSCSANQMQVILAIGQSESVIFSLERTLKICPLSQPISNQ